MASGNSQKKFWRISGYRDLSGEGAKIAAGRWHSHGNPIVYLAENPAGALLERLVHLQDGNGMLPRWYDLMEVLAPDEMLIAELLPLAEADWKEDVALTRRLGDEWLAANNTPLARVPSAIVARTWNVLLNPAHPDASKVRIESVIRDRFDNRLFRWEGG